MVGAGGINFHSGFLSPDYGLREREIHAAREAEPAKAGSDAEIADVARLLNAELEGTRQALKAAGRPTMQITLADLSPETIGRLIVTMQTATVFAADLIGVNPYGQPGVEESKRRTRAILGP